MRIGSYYILCILFMFLAFSCNANTKTNKEYIVLKSSIAEKTTPKDLVIDSVIDLKGGSIELPACSKLIFEGDGSFHNGRVYIDNITSSIVGGYGIFDNIELKPKQNANNPAKSSLPYINAHWFGAKSIDNIDNTNAIQKAIDAGHSLSVPVYLPRGYYRIYKTIRLYEGDMLKGDDIGRITPNHQDGATFIRYCGNEQEMVSVEGNNVSIENILLASSSLYLVDGISLKNNAGLYFYMNNVLIANAKYGVNCKLMKNEGFSGCVWDKVTIWKCVRGVSVDIGKDKGQYVTYNCFNNLYVSSVKEKGIYLHCRAINSCVFRDCLFDNISYGPAFDDVYKKSEKAAIYVLNEAKQGSVIVDGGYFENIYYCKESELSSTYDDSLSSVFYINNVNISISNVRFANTRTIVNSRGIDNVRIVSCIDNGYLSSKSTEKIPICKANENTVFEIDNYVFIENGKDYYSTSRGDIKYFKVNCIR